VTSLLARLRRTRQPAPVPAQPVDPPTLVLPSIRTVLAHSTGAIRIVFNSRKFSTVHPGLREPAPGELPDMLTAVTVLHDLGYDVDQVHDLAEALDITSDAPPEDILELQVHYQRGLTADLVHEAHAAGLPGMHLPWFLDLFDIASLRLCLAAGLTGPDLRAPLVSETLPPRPQLELLAVLRHQDHDQ
jgi:hypothetical protein